MKMSHQLPQMRLMIGRSFDGDDTTYYSTYCIVRLCTCVHFLSLKVGYRDIVDRYDERMYHNDRAKTKNQ